MNKKNKILILFFLLLSLFGIADSIYLTTTHYANKPLVCGILDGCNIVAQSEYSTILGIPLSLLGIFYYTILFLLAFSLLHIKNKHAEIIKLKVVLSTLGFFGSLYFVYLQLFTIKAVCIYCMWSALSSTLLFILSLLLFKAPRKTDKNTPEQSTN